MKCRQWMQIQNILDRGGDSSAIKAHLESCAVCSRRFTVYRRFTALYAAEAVGPTRMPSGNTVAVRGPRFTRMGILAAAGVFCLVLLVPGIVLPSYLKDRSLKQQFARELAQQTTETGLFGRVASLDSGYNLTWFE